MKFYEFYVKHFARHLTSRPRFMFYQNFVAAFLTSQAAINLGINHRPLFMAAFCFMMIVHVLGMAAWCEKAFDV